MGSFFSKGLSDIEETKKTIDKVMGNNGSRKTKRIGNTPAGRKKKKTPGSSKKKIPKAPKCQKKGEQLCREILEELLEPYKFPTVRPDWLKNPSTGRNLEIDCCCLELMYGVEYDGITHRAPSAYFGTTAEDVVRQKKNDRFKDRKCKQLGFHLTRVDDRMKKSEYRAYIIEQMPKRIRDKMK